MKKPLKKFEISDAVKILERTPETLRSLLSGIPDEFIESTGDKDNWSPYDVVGHLIFGEDTDWIPRAEIILAQKEDRTFPPFDRLAQFEISKDKSLYDLLFEFEEKRSEGVKTLLGWNLQPEQLQLKGVHPAFGEVTLEQLLATWVAHDLNHIRQIVVFMANVYSETVGPWKEYLSILK